MRKWWGIEGVVVIVVIAATAKVEENKRMTKINE